MPEKPSQTKPFPGIQKNRANAEARTIARQILLTFAAITASSNAFASAAPAALSNPSSVSPRELPEARAARFLPDLPLDYK
jgi:hypothetical protein